MEKQRLLYQQARLHTRGAAEMVLQMISACKGAPHMFIGLFRVHSSYPHSSWLTHFLRTHLPPLHACGLHAHPSPCSFPLHTCLAISHSSFSHDHPCMHTLAHSYIPFLTSLGMAVFCWLEHTAFQLGGPSFVSHSLQERQVPWCPPP